MENKFKSEIIIYWGELDNAFIAEVPELTGCMEDGYTYQSSFVNVQKIIEEWIETVNSLGGPIPIPKGRLLFA